MADINLYNTQTGAKLNPGETYTDSSGRSVTQGTTVGTYSPTSILGNGQVGPLAPKVSTTTISNANKIQQVPSIIEKTNTLTDTGVRTDQNSGIATYANGQAYTPIEQAKADTTDLDTQYQKNLDDMKASTDAQTADLIANIQQKFNQRRAEQADVNTRQKQGINSALLMGGVTGTGGSARYAPISSEGIISSVEANGIKQLAVLDSEEQDLITAAKAAQASNNYKILEATNAKIEKKREEKVAAAVKLNDAIAEQNKKAREANIQSSRDSAVSDLYAQGVTDVPTLLEYLNYNDKGKKTGDFTADEIAKTLKNIVPPGLDDLVKTLGTNGAPADVLQSVLGSSNLNEAYRAAGSYSAGGSGIIGEYNFYKAQAEAAGQQPVDFNTYQNQDANRKKSIAVAGIANQYGLDKEQRSRVAGLLDDYDKQAKDKKTVINQSLQIDALSPLALGSNKDKGSRAAAQIGTVFSFMKMLDPTSTVREGEYATAQNTAGVEDKIRNAYNKLVDGSFLADKQILGYVATGKALAESNKRQLETIDSEFNRRSAIFGIPAGIIAKEASTTTNESLVKTGAEAKAKVDSFVDSNPSSPFISNITSFYKVGKDDATIYEWLKLRGAVK